MTTLALYKFLFTTELLVAEALFTRRFARRKHFVWRALGGIAACYTLTALFPLFDNTYNGWYVSFMFLTLFASTFGAATLCFDVPLKNTFFCCLAAYTAQHLSYEIFKLAMAPFSFFDAKNLYGNDMLDLTKFSGESVIAALLYFDANLAVYTAAYFVIGKKISRDGNLHVKNGYMLLFSAVILLVDILLNAFTVYIESGYNKMYDVIIGLYNSLCCVLVFYIQSSIISANDMRVELNAVSELLFQAQRQYEMKKEEIDLINIKCHDLKHRISNMGGLDEPTAREINDMISIYDANVNTGNKVVDIILTEKSLVCHGKNIQLTCMADCSRLGFIADGDLYALFGNIVDNAIEATSRVDDCEKRAISLNIHTECGFVTVMCENYYDGILKLDGNGMPVTTKLDADYHGFGIKSVKAIAEKYGGRAGIVSDDDIFRINVMIPLQQQKPVE